MRVVRRVGVVLAMVVALTAGLATLAVAQDRTWIQIEARPSLAQAQARAEDWAGRIEGVEGYRLPSGWYAIALGPFTRREADYRLRALRATGAIPRDAFLADGRGFSDQFWPRGDDVVSTPATDSPAPAQITVTPGTEVPSTEAANSGSETPPRDSATSNEPPAQTAPPRGETPAEARAAERSLTRGDRAAVQEALRATGFYDGVIDSDFGPGTRRAMAEWQDATGFDATGILTTAQRRQLLQGLAEARASLGLASVTDDRAGIRIDLPLADVAFAAYEAPFARYDGDNGVQVLLISEAGDKDTLRGLYDVMQTLEIVPTDGERSFDGDAFTLTGANDRIVSQTEARLDGGAVKGFTLVWPAGDEARRAMALQAMRASFEPIPGIVLPDDAGDRSQQGPDLVAGLQVRGPETSASGFYVSADGKVLTTAAVADCKRVTLDGATEADVVASDPATGLALLAPRARLAPIGLGRISAEVPLLQSEIAVAGYSWGGVLGAPTTSFGTLADIRGLDGQDAMDRLVLAARPGDAGGPVLDGGGGVVGMLLPRDAGDRQLPADVHFAADAEAIAGFLGEHGIDPMPVTSSGPLPPEDIAKLGADMTVLVECWN